MSEWVDERVIKQILMMIFTWMIFTAPLLLFIEHYLHMVARDSYSDKHYYTTRGRSTTILALLSKHTAATNTWSEATQLPQTPTDHTRLIRWSYCLYLAYLRVKVYPDVAVDSAPAAVSVLVLHSSLECSPLADQWLHGSASWLRE